jgi:hypothetical protein
MNPRRQWHGAPEKIARPFASLASAQRHRCRWLGASLALAALALAVLPAGAEASPSRYVYEMCDSVLPGGGVAGVLHSQSGGQPWGLDDNCDEPGGSLAVRETGPIAAPGGSATWGVPLKPPPGGSMESLARPRPAP